ncbi:MAG: sodium-transporting two-sector ATPase [Candidatus Saccharibacteria bacterium]
MSDTKMFKSLVEKGNETGEVVYSDRFLAHVNGLEKAMVGSVVIFEDGSTGLIQGIFEDYAEVLNLSTEIINIGTLVVAKSEEISVKVSKDMLGRIVDPLGRPVDGLGIFPKTQEQKIFGKAMAFKDRAILSTQLETGITLVDTLFPVVYGQRIAIMGDTKSGKTTFLTQIAINQARKGKIIVYVLIGKRKADIEVMINRFTSAKVKDKIVLVLADVFDSLPVTYLAPYSGCTIAEFFWHSGEDVIIIYDDLSSHAKAYRELSLLMRKNPGREAYPGDMFYVHSSLLERAGKILSNGKTLTSLPVSVTPNDDITGFLSTTLISITDGQIIFDNNIMRQGIKPAINVGISVSRVGGRGQTKTARYIARIVSSYLANYRTTLETSRFVSEQSNEAKATIRIGERIYGIFGQNPNELFTLIEEQIMLQVALGSGDIDNLDIDRLKATVKSIPTKEKGDKNIDEIVQKIIAAES